MTHIVRSEGVTHILQNSDFPNRCYSTGMYLSVWLPFDLGFLESRNWILHFFFVLLFCSLAQHRPHSRWVCIYLIKQSWPCSKKGFQWP